MDSIKLRVSERTETGNGPARRLRASGNIPGVVYSKGTEPTVISIDFASLREALAHGHNVVMELEFGETTKSKKSAKSKASARYAVIKEMQFHPTRRKLLHVDLHQVDLKQEIEVPVAIEFVGTPAGVADGGIADFEHREVLVRALPNDVPSSIALEVSELLIGQHLTVAALSAPDGVTIVDDPDTVVVTLVPPRIHEEPTEAIEEEEFEPEVVGEAEPEE